MKYIKKADIILFIVLIAAGIAASAALALTGSGTGDKVIIESDGELFATYSLHEDRTVVVPSPKATQTAKSVASGEEAADAAEDEATVAAGEESVQYDYYNIVKIKDGEVSVTEASCKNQVCVKHSSISASGESIICLPNRMIVRIEGSGAGSSEEGGGYDTVTS